MSSKSTIIVVCLSSLAALILFAATQKQTTPKNSSGSEHPSAIFSPTKNTSNTFNDAYSKFNASPAGSVLALEELDSIRKHATPSVDVISKIRKIAFDSSRTTDERASAIRIYGNLIIQSKDPNIIDSLRNDLLQLISSKEEYQVGRSATFSYTRSLSSGDPNSLLISSLEKSKENNYINSDDYSGEIVHRTFVSTPVSDELLDKINKDDNPYGKTVLFNYLSDPSIAKSAISSINPKQSAELISSVKESKPSFSGQYYSLSLVEGVQYSEWAKSYANTQSINQTFPTQSYNDAILNIFDNPEPDPRPKISLLYSTDRDIILEAAAKGDLRAANGINQVREFINLYGHLPEMKNTKEDILRYIK